MTPAASIPPVALSVDASPGRMSNATRHYQKRFADLAGLYGDAAAFEALRPAMADAVVYQVWEHRASEATGDLIFGTSVMNPGRVGEEFFMTRGHQHQVADRAEVYHCVAGRGVMLLEDAGGEIRALEMTPGTIAYVPPHWIHRSVNTGPDLLITVFSYGADAGQDYQIIESGGGMRCRVVQDGATGWRLEANPAWRPRG
jgi:glucose-6-phosphate isomerase, archaeal